MTLPIEEQRQARAVRQLQSAAGGVEASGAICEKSPSLHSAYQSPNDGRSIPVRDIERLESVTHGSLGHPHVTSYLAAAQGFILVLRPVVPANRAAIIELLSQHAKAKGHCETEILHALSDGEVDGDEATSLIPLFRRSFEITNQMLAELEAIAGSDAS